MVLETKSSLLVLTIQDSYHLFCHKNYQLVFHFILLTSLVMNIITFILLIIIVQFMILLIRNNL